MAAVNLAQRLPCDSDAIDSVAYLVTSGCPRRDSRRTETLTLEVFRPSPNSNPDHVVTTHRSGTQHNRIVLNEMGISIRIVSCDGVSVALEVIAPPSMSVRAVKDVFPQPCNDESEDATRPSTLGWSE